jgi:nucleoside recognition membrane protein YjiH
MLESIFIIMLIIGILLFLISIENESYAFGIMSAITWVFNLANSLNIEINDGATTVGTQDYGLNAFCILFILLSIIMAVNFWIQRYDKLLG